jgi:hypothetical protein
MAYAQRPAQSEYLEYYHKYISRVPKGDIIAILATQLEDTLTLLRDVSDERGLHAYAPGKWTIKEVIGHMSDVERVMSYRALRFARGDRTPLPGFDENAYAPAGEFNARPIASLLAELTSARRATVALLAGLPAAAWARDGAANNAAVTVRALAWIIAGHELHHRELLATRYLAAATP